jgi:DNA-binding response OmpR family regulator
MFPNTSPISVPLPDVLVVDGDVVTTEYATALGDRYRITTAATAGGALTHLAQMSPTLVATELDLSDGSGSGEEVCRRAKALAIPATVLVMTRDPHRAPSALLAGCDGVLLKPFAPNLLHARIGRLLRARALELRLRARQQVAKSAHLLERTELFAAKSNQVWSNTHCPHCQRLGVTSFDFASHRRAWYACTACQKVWIAKRQE